MYKDEDGNFNGDCLIVYFKKDSVHLAIRMMDDYYFRIEDQSQGTIHVKEADFSYKKHKDGDEIASGDDLRRAVAAAEPGDKLELTVQRNGETKTVTATLGKRPTQSD